MKIQAKELKKGDKIIHMGQEAVISEIELSEIGKHGKRKARIVALNQKQEKIVIIRPEDYPIEKA